MRRDGKRQSWKANWGSSLPSSGRKRVVQQSTQVMVPVVSRLATPAAKKPRLAGSMRTRSAPLMMGTEEMMEERMARCTNGPTRKLSVNTVKRMPNSGTPMHSYCDWHAKSKPGCVAR